MAPPCPAGYAKRGPRVPIAAVEGEKKIIRRNIIRLLILITCPMKPAFALIGSALLLAGCQERQDDAAAIQEVLQKEAATWRSGDAAAHAACWSIRPYSRILVSTPEGVSLDIAPALMIEPSPAMGQGGVARQSNYKPKGGAVS